MGISERRAREREQRKRSILDTARTLFFEHDYEAVTMSQIAAAAELGKGTLYSYFDSKEAIYLALVREGLGILEGLVAQTADTADGDTADRMRALGATFLGFYGEHPEYFRILFFLAHTDVVSSRPDDAEQLFEVGHRIRRRVADVVRGGVADGSVGTCDPQLTADVLWAALLGLAMQMQMEREFIRHSPEELFLRLAEILLAGLAAPSALSESAP